MRVAINHWDVPLSFSVGHWEETSYWEGSNYVVYRNAEFRGEVWFCGISKDGSGPSICLGKIYDIDLTFVLEPGGKYSADSTYSSPPL